MFISSTQGTPPPNRQKCLAGRWQGRGKGEKAERGVVRKQNGRYIPQQWQSGINYTLNLLQLTAPPTPRFIRLAIAESIENCL